MFLVQILLPLTDNSGESFGKASFDAVKNELTDAYGGVTAYVTSPAEGLWEDGDSDASERVVLFEVMTETLDQSDWTARRRSLEKRFRQERIVIRYMSIGVV